MPDFKSEMIDELKERSVKQDVVKVAGVEDLRDFPSVG